MARAFATSGTTRAAMNMRPDVAVSIEVDAHEPIDMMERVWAVFTGPNIATFLEGPAHSYLEKEIVNRFAYQGDRQVGHWPDLSEATVEIRESLGYPGDWPINVRTEELFETLVNERDIIPGEAEALMRIPGSAGQDASVAAKLETAQSGRPGPNPMSPNFGMTPPRPVLAADETNLVALLEILNRWVIWEIARGFV